MDAARIVGVYTTRQARSLRPRTTFSVALEALQGALADAGMDVSEIDGISSALPGWPYASGFWGGSRQRPEQFWARQLRRPMHWLSSNFGVPAILEAAAAIGNGLVSTAAVVVGQVQQVQTGSGEATAPWTRPDAEFTEWTGSFTAVQYGVVAQRYMHEYGSEALQAMAEASAVIRNYGNVNPDAVYFGRGPYSAKDVLSSRTIATPLTLLMCSGVNDGGGAVILTHRDRAKDSRKRPVRILAGANQQPYPPYFEVPSLDSVPDESAFVNDALARGGIVPGDMDVAELYDHFAIGVLMELELYGFCGRGEAADFVAAGELGLTGRLPTCTDGGCLSFSHNGFPPLFKVIEAVRQLRGEVKDLCPGWERGQHSHDPLQCRAVKDTQLAFASNPGPPTGGGSFAVFGVD